MSTFLSSTFKFSRICLHQIINARQFHALPISASKTNYSPISSPSYWFNAIRTIIRNNFPRAREGKRVKTLGWKARLSTKNGRRIIMRRILKGRFYLSH